MYSNTCPIPTVRAHWSLQFCSAILQQAPAAAGRTQAVFKFKNAQVSVSGSRLMDAPAQPMAGSSESGHMMAMAQWRELRRLVKLGENLELTNKLPARTANLEKLATLLSRELPPEPEHGVCARARTVGDCG